MKEYHSDVQPLVLPGGKRDGETEKFYVLEVEANRLYLLSESAVIWNDIQFETQELLFV